MDKAYQYIWELAKPYYEKGRFWDIDHVQWMVRKGEPIGKKLHCDMHLLIPLILLHDVGYSILSEKNPQFKHVESKRIHMQEGARIAQSILEEAGYDPVYIPRITRYVSMHDNWVFGDDRVFRECIEIALFNDLDFLWVTSGINIFRLSAESMKMKLPEFYLFWEKDEKLIRRPFCCPATKKLFEEGMYKISAYIYR